MLISQQHLHNSNAAFKAPPLHTEQKIIQIHLILQVRGAYHVRKISATLRIQCWNGVSRAGVTFLAKTYFHVFAFTWWSRGWFGQFGIQYFNREYQNTIFHIKGMLNYPSFDFVIFMICHFRMKLWMLNYRNSNSMLTLKCEIHLEV